LSYLNQTAIGDDRRIGTAGRDQRARVSPAEKISRNCFAFRGRIREREDYRAVDVFGHLTHDVGHGVARVGAVNEIQYELDTFNMWHNLRRNGTLRTSELTAVQIVLPSTFFCSDHRQAQPLLDDPEARVDAHRRPPNRAERRRRRHRH